MTEQKTQRVTNYSSDSDELLGIMEHFKTDDRDNYIGSNLNADTQEIILNAVNAAVDGTEIPTSEDEATQLLINISVMAAQGGRESEIPAKVAENLAAGNEGDSMLAAVLLSVPYNGFPRTLNATAAISSALEDENTQEELSEKPTVTMQVGSAVMTVNGVEQNIDKNGTVP